MLDSLGSSDLRYCSSSSPSSHWPHYHTVLSILCEPIVVSVEFAEASYTVSEASMSVELCVNLTGQLEREALILLSTTDGGAATAGEDYLRLTETLTFVEQESIICSQLEVLNDSFIENSEAVMISLSTNDSAVDVTSASVNVLILDSNREIIITSN